MDVRFLESLVAVIDKGSIAEAARQQNLTAAAVGQRVRALERQLNERLVTRSGSTVRPTPACLRILPRIRSLLSQMTLLQQDLAADGLAGPYRLGVISTALADHAVCLVEGFAACASNVELSVVPGTSQQLYEMLSEGALDAAILVEPPFSLAKAFLTTILEPQPLAWVMPKKSVSDNLPLIVYDRLSWGGAIGWRWITANASARPILCEMDAPETVATLVASGIGCALLPVWAGLMQIPGVRVERLSNGPVRNLVFLRPNGTRTPIDDVCLALLQPPFD